MKRRDLLQIGAAALGAGALQLGPFAPVAGARSALSVRPMIGVAYYPEQVMPALWPDDIAQISRLGATFVRMAEFSWSRLEPEEGLFDFNWLRSVVDRFHAAGVATVLGTPTAAPPPWVTTAYPDVLMVTKDGGRLTPGSRRFTCPTSPRYRDLAARITTAMAKAFADAPGVIGWQIDNELTMALHSRCYCDSCRSAFHDWVRSRYGTLDATNAAWGTAFWSATYTDFSQIPLPLASGGAANPGLELDYDRFQSDAYVSFLEAQVGIVRKTCPGHFITTNTLPPPAFNTIDLPRLTRTLDFLSLDNYPGLIAAVGSFLDWGLEKPATLEGIVAFTGMINDVVRSAKPGRPHLVMEQQVGKVGQKTMLPQPAAGQIRLWCLQAIAHGAGGFSFFRWDSANAGQEQNWHGLLNHDRSPTAAFEEIRRVIAETKALGPVLDAPFLADVAFVHNYDSDWAAEIQPDLMLASYKGLLVDWYASATARRSSIGFVGADQDLGGYRIAIAPCLNVVTPAEAEKLRAFVHDGGLLISGPRLALRTPAGGFNGQSLPGALRDVIGIIVRDYTPLDPAPVQLAMHGELAHLGNLTARAWAERIAADKAVVLARFADGPYSGQPAVTSNSFGKGRAIYLGALLPRPMLRRLFDAFAYADVPATIDAPAGVEITRRGTASSHVTFVLNHNGQTVEASTGPGSYRDRLSGERLSGAFPLAPYQVRILEQAPRSTTHSDQGSTRRIMV